MNKNKNNGFTLVEVLVAIGISIFLMFAMTKLFINNKILSVSQHSSSKVQNDSNFSMFLLSNDIALTGYRGCFSGPLNTSDNTKFNNVSGTATYYNSTLFVQGSRGLGTTFSPTLNSSVSGLSPAPDPKKDMLTIRGATTNPSFLATNMAETNSVLRVTSATDIKRDGLILITNCNVSSLFKVSAISGANVTANNDLNAKFKQSDQLFSYNTTVYYVGRDDVLYKSVNGATPEKIAYNVEKFTIMYGVDTNSKRNATQYLYAPEVVDFNRVVSLKLGMVIRGDDINTVGTNKEDYKYQFNGEEFSTSDGKLRRVYYKTIALRNMLL